MIQLDSVKHGTVIQLESVTGSDQDAAMRYAELPHFDEPGSTDRGLNP